MQIYIGNKSIYNYFHINTRNITNNLSLKTAPQVLLDSPQSILTIVFEGDARVSLKKHRAREPSPPSSGITVALVRETTQCRLCLNLYPESDIVTI